MVRHVILSVHFVLTKVSEGHAKPIAHGRAAEGRVRAQTSHRFDKKLATRFLVRIIAFHQSHSRAVNAFLIVAVIERKLVSNRFDLQRGGDQEGSGQRNLTDHQNTGDDVHRATRIAAPPFFHHIRGIAPGADQCRN